MSRIQPAFVNENISRGAYSGTGGLKLKQTPGINTPSVQQTVKSREVEQNAQPEAGRPNRITLDRMTKKEFVTTVAFEEDLQIAGMKKKQVRNGDHIVYDPLKNSQQGFVGANAGTGVSGNSQKFGDVTDPSMFVHMSEGASNVNPTGMPAGRGADVNLRTVQSNSNSKVSGRITL